MIKLKNANEAALVVLKQAMLAAAQGTFCVGGIIVDNQSGNIINSMHNNVLKPLFDGSTFTYDPTAHGERQLVYWYYDNKKKLKLPDPEKLTIITSLDPCLMCAGTLLTAGFNVGIVAIDDFAGINYNKKFDFKALPVHLRSLAKSKFGYYACGQKGKDHNTYIRKYIGGPNVAFKNSAIDSQILVGCESIFLANLVKIREKSANFGLEPLFLKDPSNLPDNSAIKSQYQKIYPEAFKLKISHTRLPDKKLLKILRDIEKSTPSAKNVVALIDSFGNIALCLPDTFNISPVHTAFMNVTQNYSKLRFELMNNPKTKEEATNYLTHPKHGTLVFLYAPDATESATIMDLGAYGSTMEGPIPQIFPSNLQYFYPPKKEHRDKLESVVMNLPPFYVNLVQISPQQVIPQ